MGGRVVAVELVVEVVAGGRVVAVELVVDVEGRVVEVELVVDVVVEQPRRSSS